MLFPKGELNVVVADLIFYTGRQTDDGDNKTWVRVFWLSPSLPFFL